MRMTINKPRQHKPPLSLNHNPRIHPTQPPNNHNPPTFNPHIPPKPRRSGPIDNPSTPHHNIKSHAPIQPPDLETPTQPTHLKPRSRHFDLCGKRRRYARRLLRVATVLAGRAEPEGNKQAGWVGEPP
ncbi:hypothetical protein Aple_090630 [Acrocarpospora pleiomorpha]|uniref:Uncharacterized protein n=1 Tax=Acrocarpospora pleiomorpha TaxID=90975 RepID=A0A5M3XYF3_9ACTN|nr:hypothetical protein Aple_090630 [Acrocarpospora pleiomorpha]